MSDNSYLMPAQNGQHEIITSRSRFICHVFRVETVKEANSFIETVRTEHAKANHNPVAYLIGDHNEFGKATDDGEPSGTAGAPMLDVLQRQNIRNCLIIVTRYFGGIKLGAGGLIRAYGSAASVGLQAIGLVRRIQLQSIWLELDYALRDILQSKIVAQGYAVGQVEYSDRVTLEALVPAVEKEAFKKWVVDFSNNSVLVTEGNLSWKELKV